MHDLHHHHPFHHHDPWAHNHDAPDPDEDDIDNVQWRSTGPGTGTMQFQVIRSFSPTAQAQGHQHNLHQQDYAGNPLMQSFATMLGGILGGRPDGQDQPGAQNQPAGQNRPPTHQTARDTPQSPQNEQANQPGQPGVRTYQGDGPGFAWSATTRVIPGPRDANNPQPQTQPFDDLPNFLNQMFPLAMGGPPGGAQRGGPGGPGADFGHMGPLGGLFAGLLNPANMQHGDAVYSQEALDRIISQLMEQNASGNAPGPATAEAIANLPQKTIAESDLDDQGNADCSICMDSVNIGSKVTLLPCNHWFHAECIKAWLGEHDTCPHCRQGIMPRDGPDSTPRNSDQQPRHDQNWSQQGTRTNPFTVPESPTQPAQRRPSSSSRSGDGGAGGLFSRMRDAFGGGSPAPQR